MSMSWEHKCNKCGREFDSFSPRHPICNDCMVIVKVKDLPSNKVLTLSDCGGYQKAKMFVKDLSDVLGDMDFVSNDSGFELILEKSEIDALENHIGHKIIFK